MAVDLEPADDSVLLEPFPFRKKFPGTDMLAPPDTKPFPHSEGVVVKVGSGVRDVKRGDVVACQYSYAGTPIQIDGHEMLVVPREQLMLKWDGEGSE